MKSKALVKVGHFLRKSCLKARKAAPTILVGSGAVAVIGGAIWGCISTTKVPDVMEEHNERLAVVENNPNTTATVKRVYFKTILNFMKLYAPAAAVLIIGLVMIFGSHSIMQTRNALLSAQLLTVTQAFNAYREKVAKEFGTDKDLEFAHNDEIVIGEDGKELRFERCECEDAAVKYYNKNTSTCWVPGSYDVLAMNLSNIQAVERVANIELSTQGYLMLNDVLDQLGMEKTKLGYALGWIADQDTMVEFRPTVVHGRYDDDNLDSFDCPAIRLDFNISGPILDKLDIPRV